MPLLRVDLSLLLDLSFWGFISAAHHYLQIFPTVVIYTSWVWGVRGRFLFCLFVLSVPLLPSAFSSPCSGVGRGISLLSLSGLNFGESLSVPES